MMVFKIPRAILDANDMMMRSKNPNHRALALNEIKTTPGDSVDLAIGRGKVIFPKKGDGLIRCYHCGRKLTDGTSRMRGVGPVCFSRLGRIAGRPTNPMEVYKLYVKACKQNAEVPMTFIEWVN